MKLNMNMDKRKMILISAVVGTALVFFLFIKPLWSKAGDVSREAKALNDELIVIREALAQGGDFHKDRHPLSRGEISMAINEIMEVGAKLDIDFFSTSPQQIQKSEGSKYPVLPINLEIQSSYENFGMFLGALENFDKSIVTVRQFEITRKPMILPKIYVELVVDIHLKEGEGGQK